MRIIAFLRKLSRESISKHRSIHSKSDKMMKYIEAPNLYEGVEKSIFMAGGISGCPDWHSDIVKLLSESDLTLLNPRRKNFPINDPSAASGQIKWEYDHLRKASAILFWFPCETLCPITLYELGAWSMSEKPILLGVHPDYQRRQDVEIQTRLIRPDISIVYSVQALAEQVLAWNQP